MVETIYSFETVPWLPVWNVSCAGHVVGCVTTTLFILKISSGGCGCGHEGMDHFGVCTGAGFDCNLPSRCVDLSTLLHWRGCVYGLGVSS